MIGYATSGRLRPANPAKWLKHTLMQLASTAGRYRAITSQAKRDWHKLLESQRTRLSRHARSCHAGGRRVGASGPTVIYSYKVTDGP